MNSDYQKKAILFTYAVSEYYPDYFTVTILEWKQML